MGAHLFNPNAIAKANGTPLPPKGGQNIRVISLGDDYFAAGFEIVPAVNGEGELCAVLAVVAGKNSQLVGPQMGRFLLGEIGKVPVAKVKELVDGMLNPKPVEEAKTEEPTSS